MQTLQQVYKEKYLSESNLSRIGKKEKASKETIARHRMLKTSRDRTKANQKGK
jgi:hypothetical protein